MKATILYDNYALEGFEADHGFACLVETTGGNVLFDTGAKGPLLLSHMKKAGLDPGLVDCLVISHDHWDHNGGMKDFLALRDVPTFAPESFKTDIPASNVIRVGKTPVDILPGIHSTGELGDFEHGMAVETGRGVVLTVGCSHPGVGELLDAAESFGRVRGVLGGLHGFDDFDVLEDLDFLFATHCTKKKKEIEIRFPGKCLSGGAGSVFEF